MIRVAFVLSAVCGILACGPSINRDAVTLRKAALCTASNEEAAFQMMYVTQSVPQRIVVRREQWEKFPSKDVFMEWAALCLYEADEVVVFLERTETPAEEGEPEVLPESRAASFKVIDRYPFIIPMADQLSVAVGLFIILQLFGVLWFVSRR